MGGRLLDALLDLDAAGRVAERVLGRSACGQRLRDALAAVRRQVAARALAEEAAGAFDPKTDLARIFAAAEAAGLSWPDLRDALNDYQQRAHHG